jgi:hypothetical protein
MESSHDRLRYYDNDADVKAVDGKKIVFLGYVPSSPSMNAPSYLYPVLATKAPLKHKT